MAELDAISESVHSENEGNPIMDFLKKVFSVTPAAASAAKKGLVMPKDYQLKDNRKISATTGKAIDPNRDLIGGKYPSERILNIVKSAKMYNQDPYDLLAVDLQETGLGTSKRKGNDAIGHAVMNMGELIPTKMGSEEESDDYDKFTRAFVTKMQYADKLGIKDPHTKMQTYNGLGKITPNTESGYHGFAMQSIYGVPLPKEGIDMRKNPLYGKRVLDLRDNVLRKDEQLANYIKNIR